MCYGYEGVQKMSRAGAGGRSNELQQQSSFYMDLKGINMKNPAASFEMSVVFEISITNRERVKGV